jgi:hypothetical protein
VKTIPQIHLERVAELECNLQENKIRNEKLNHLLGQAGEMSTKIRTKMTRGSDIAGPNAQVDGKHK